MKYAFVASTALTCSLLASLAAAAPGGFAPEAESAAEAPQGAMLLPIRNARIPMPGVLSGGQPTPEQIETAARAGFRTVINLRTDGESGFDWEADAVERLGMRYVQIPVAGADGLTRDNVERIDAALRGAVQEGPVLLHCGSGNRIGAVLALRAAWLEGADAEQALRHGQASGLTRLEGATRERLGLAADGGGGD